VGLLACLMLLVMAAPGTRASAADARTAELPILIAQAEDAASRADSQDETGGSGRLEPRYQPREPEEKSWYNSSYIFGMTRSLAASTISPAGKAPLFVLTIPLDIVFLPFAAIGGLFG
jgi:hypothetical protein